MKITLKRLVPAALLLLLGGVWFLATLPKGEEIAKKEGPASAAPPQELEGVRLEGGTLEGTRWNLYAKSAVSDAAGEIGALNEVRAEFTSKAGATVGVARKAEKLRSGGYLFSGAVELAREDWTARTESARYDPDRGVITAEGQVTITSGRVTVTGRGLVADQAKNSAIILHDSHAIFQGGQ